METSKKIHTLHNEKSQSFSATIMIYWATRWDIKFFDPIHPFQEEM